MAKSDEVRIDINTKVDPSGADAAGKAVEDVGKKSKKAGTEGKTGLDKLRASTSGLTTAMKTLRTVMMGFGIIGFIKMAADAVRKLDEMVNARKRLSQEIQSQNDENATNRLLDVYKQITEEINKANEAREAANSLEDKQLASVRKLEDAQLRLGEEKEVQALDSNDPDRALKEQQIRARYAATRERTSSTREGEDIEREATRKEAQAAADTAALEENTAAIRELQAAFTTQSAKATQAQGQATGLWSHLTGRKELYQNISAGHAANSAQIADQLRTAHAEQTRLQQSRDRNIQEAAIARQSLGAVTLNNQATDIIGTRNIATADNATAKAHRDREEARQAQANAADAKARTEAQQRRAQDAQNAQHTAMTTRDAFDNDRRNATTTNRTDRDNRRAPLEEAVKQTETTTQREIALLQQLTASQKKLEQEAKRLQSRLTASSCDAATD